MPALVVRKLKKLADQINAEHAACKRALEDAYARWIEVGRLLCEAKAEINFGGWIDWIEENCTFNRQQANKYIRAFENRMAIEEEMSISDGQITSLESALRAISDSTVEGNVLVQKSSDGTSEIKVPAPAKISGTSNVVIAAPEQTSGTSALPFKLRAADESDAITREKSPFDKYSTKALAAAITRDWGLQKARDFRGHLDLFIKLLEDEQNQKHAKAQ
jgi:Protein of unknown function (DUF3102)